MPGRQARPDEGRPAAGRARLLLGESRGSGGRRCGPTTGCGGATRWSRCSTSRRSSPERAVHEWSANVFRDDDGTILSGQYRLMIRTERKKAREKKKYDAIEPARYTDDEIDAIDAEYAAYRAPRRRAAVLGGRRRGRRGRPDGEGPADGHRHGVLARRAWAWASTTCKPLALGAREPPADPAVLPPRRPERPRRDAARALGSRVGPASRATPPPTTTAACARPGSSTSAPTGWATTPGSGSSSASSAGSTTSATPTTSPARSSRKYLADGDRPAVDLELAAANQRGDRHHARAPPRSCCPAASTGRCACPTRPAARDLEHRARPRSATRSRRRDERLRVGRRSRHRARRRRAAPAPGATRQAQRAQRHDDVRRHRRGRPRRARRSGARDPAHRRGRPLLLRLRHRGPQPGAKERQQAPRRQHPAPAAVAGAPPDPAAAAPCRSRWCARCGAGPRASASTSRWPPTSPSPPTDARFWAPFVDRGFTPDSGATWLLPRRIGEVRAREMILLGRGRRRRRGGRAGG